ncbi:hypothetical protein ACK8N7_13660 [Streptomyces griseobrunneus]|uniref:hypothetical protein n=1 Tax=Streptomyces microflavus TaxID=1919 RepID=UPI003804F324
MQRRPLLPPPPPPVEIRSWPDREAMLTDRALILGVLVRMHVGPGRFGVLVMWAGLAAFGWLLAGSAFVVFEQAQDVFGGLAGLLSLLLGVGAMVPGIAFVCLYVARDRKVRALLV